MKQQQHYEEILALVSRIGRLTNPQHLSSQPGARISLTQFLVLDVLDGEATPLRMSSLAARAGLPASELTRVVKELLREAWVSREEDPEDSRARRVAISAVGRRHLRRVQRSATAELRGVWSDFTHDEWHRFIDFLRRFERGLARVRERGDDAPSSRSPEEAAHGAKATKKGRRSR